MAQSPYQPTITPSPSEPGQTVPVPPVSGPPFRTPDYPPPCKPVRFPTAAVVTGSLLFLACLVAGGISNACFGSVAILDFMAGASLWARFPALMWAIWGLVIGGTLGFWLEAPLYGLRRQRAAIIAAPLLLLFVVAFAAHWLRPLPAWPADPVAPAPPPPLAPNFAGGWDTGQWGQLTLTQDGSHVFGTSTYRGGVIEGTASPQGNGTTRLTFRWRNQEGGAKGVGYFDLTADAQSFDGGWAEGENLYGEGRDWTGRRTAAPPPPPSFTGDWTTEWGDMHLDQGVSTVAGTYQYGGGTIAGNLNGSTLNFRWLNRVTGQSGTGTFTLATYGRSFTGNWNADGFTVGTSGGVWTGLKK